MNELTEQLDLIEIINKSEHYLNTLMRDIDSIDNEINNLEKEGNRIFILAENLINDINNDKLTLKSMRGKA